MRVVADENMPGLSLWQEAGYEVTTLPGRSISAESLGKAEILLVRSVTPVTAELINGSSLRFVGSATSGIDHVDLKALDSANIRFAHAPGANARSVVDYVLSSLAALNVDRGFDWLDASIGIIGCGQTGGRLLKVLKACGLDVKYYDPFLNDGSECRLTRAIFDEMLACDVITLHVPLTDSGPHPTRHLFDARVLDVLQGHQVLINSARGAVVDNHALLMALEQGHGPTSILDVWENEPRYSMELAARVFMATPHIAGYSHEGKLRGTAMLLQAWEGRQEDETQPEQVFELDLAGRQGSVCGVVSSLMLDAYDIRNDASRFRACQAEPSPAACFDSQRKGYPVRHEYPAFRVRGADSQPHIVNLLQALGFRLA